MISLVTMKSSLQVAAMLTACLFSLSIAQKCNTVTQIGLADENIIPSDSIITSSEKEDHEKDKIRFDCCQGTYGQAWCPADGDANPFVEIHLSNPVAIGQIKIQPPTTLASPANYFYPDKFMKTFDLFFKLEGIHDLVRVAEDITAIPNKTVTMAVLSLNPSLQTDIIRIEPNQYEKEPCFRLELYQCDVASMCPTNFCQNGGVCAGENTCDCTSTLHYGEMCQYTKTQIPVEIYTFLQIVNQLLITTAHNFTFQGQVSLLNSAGLKYILVPPKAIVDLTGTDIDSCLSHIDSCTSGFTIRVDFSFSKIVTTETQIVLTTGAVFEAGVNGILFYFNAGRVFCYVLTSSQAWHVLETFTLTENKWYGMIISWSPGTGLVLLEGSNVLGSSFMPSAVNAPNSKPLTIGYSVLTTTAELRLKSLIIVPLFWREVFRAGISLDIETTAEPTATTTTPVPTTPWVPDIETTAEPTATTTTPVPTTPWVPVCQQTLGMADGTIIPSQIMASSFVAGHGIEKLRAGCCQGEEDGGWCADPNDSNPWVQVTFPDPKAIAAINFQLPERVDNTVIPANYVKTVRVEYRDVASNSTDMEIYSQNIPATYNATVAYSIGLKPSIVTDTLRMYITSSEGNACFRFELKGCKPEDLCQPNFCGNSGKCMGQNRCQCPANFYGERCQLTGEDVAETEIGFKDKSNSTITTTDSNTTLTTSGNVSLVKMDNKQIIQLTDGGTVTFPFDRCLQDLNKCGAGFTTTFVVSLLAITDDELVIATSGGHKPNAQGMSIVYNKREQKLFFRVTTSAQTWTVTTSFTWHENTWYRLTVSWSPATGVKLIVNSVLIGSTVGSDPVSISDSKPGPLCLGCGVQTTITIRIKVVFIAHVFINDLVKADIIESISRPTSPQPATTTTTTTTTSTLELSTTAVPATTIPSVQTIEEHKWTLTSVSQNVIVSYGWELTLTGSPVSGTDGVELNSDDDQLEIPNLSRTCLTNPELCTDGLTIEINIKLTSLEENSIIFTTGGEVPDHPGVTLLYRFGLVHAIVSTSTHSWYVAVSHKAIITKDFCSIILSWSATTQLKVLVNKVVVGMSASSVIHTTSTTSITGNLTIGGGATRCVVNSINIWLVHIKILIQIGVIQVSSSTTTPRPTDTSTLPSVRPTIALPISTTEDGYCNPGCISSEECFDYFTDPPYPPSPQPSECPTAPSTAATTERPTTEHPTEAQTTEESTTEAPTTKEPTTEAPTTEKPTSAALTTEEPTTEQMTTAKQTTDEPTTAEPTTEEPTTEEQTTETATTEQPTTEEPTTEEPTTEEPTTEEPTTEEPTTEEPTTEEPTTEEPTTEEPTTEEPTTEEPTTEEPTTEEPTTEEPTSEEPTTEEPITEVQTTEKLTTEEPTTEEPTTSEPTSTTTAATTTTTTPKTTITTTPTTTTATTTTTTTTTTTKPPCPEPPASVGLTPEVDLTGQGQLVCYVTQVPGPGVAIRFTWQISGISQTWSKIIEAPDTGATLSASEIGIDLLDKRIICYAEVRQLSENAEWCGHVDSNPVTPSVKCPPGSTRVTVVEGKGPQSLLVEFTVPPSLLCKPVDNGQCRVDVTTTLVTKSGNEIKCSSNEIIPQAVFGVTLVGSGQKCGLTVDNDNWKNGVAFPIKATIDGIRDRQRIRTLTISVTVNGQVTSATHVLKECSVEVEAVDKDGSDSCASVNDPHIRTFDKVRFDNFIAGEFVLYQHTSIEYEVRAIYGRCFPQRTATCNCAAAVRSGDDVITFDTCDARINQVNSIRRKSVIVVDMYKNGDLTPGTRIIRRGCGQSYEVHLPSGTVVVISSSKKPFMNIHIHASAVDFEQTRGLCGDYDGDRNNDLQGHDGRRPDEFSKQWLRTETIFKGVAPLEPSVSPTYCSCLSTQEHVCAPGLDTYKCSNGGGGISGNDITDVLVSQAKTPQVQSSNRRRRALRDEQVPKDPVSLNDEISLLDDEVNYDTENATAYCRNFLESQAQVRTCERYLLDVNATEESIQNCAVDLEELGDKTWAESHLDDIIETCITDVKTDPNFWNGILDDGPELPADISAELCVENCGDNGDCVTGVCVCKDGWTGETCDIGQDTIPIVLSAVQPCDLMTSSCAEVRIEGDGFLESETLLCRFRYVTISDHVRITNEETIRPARFISLTQVICPQPVSGSARGRHALVTVSNNGVDFSTESYMHLVEKSSCQDCTVSGNMLDVSCSYLPGVCIIDDLCYSRYEEFPGDSCYRCDPDINPTRWTRTSEPECVATVEPVSTSNSCNDDTLVIVLGVLVAVLAVVSIGLSIAYLRNRKLTKLKSNLMDMESSFDTRFSQRADDDLTGNGRAARLNHHYNPTFTR